MLSTIRSSVATLALSLTLLGVYANPVFAAEPSVTIGATAGQNNAYTFSGSVDTLTGAWTAGAQCVVKVTNLAGGTAIPSFFGQVNVTQTAWGPTAPLTLDKGKYVAVVELKFTKQGVPNPTIKTATVLFEVK